MKKCIYCAEEVRDEARICRYCGRPFLDRAQKISYSEGEYSLGATDNSYAIWSVPDGGLPQEEFSPNEAGWQKAWTRWQELQGRASLSESSNVPPVAISLGSRSPAAVFGGTNRKAIASLVLGIFWLAGIGSVAAIVLGLMARNEIRASQGSQSGTGIATAGLIIGVLGLLLLLRPAL